MRGACDRSDRIRRRPPRPPRSPARAGPCGRSRRDPGRLRGDRRRRGGGRRRAERRGRRGGARGRQTAYYLVHSMEAADGPRLRRPRPARGRAFGEAAAAAGVKRIVYLGGIAPAGRALAPPALATRGRGDPARRGARLDRAASLDRDRRRLGLVPAARAAGRAPARPAHAGLARKPHPADRRARRTRVPRAHPRHVPRPRAGRSTSPARTWSATATMIERIAELMGVGRMPLRLSPLPDAARERGRQRCDRAAGGARTPADGEPGVGHSPARPREAPRLYGLRPRTFERAVEHALADWESREPWGAVKVERSIEHRRAAREGVRADHGSDPAGGLGLDSPSPGGRAARPAEGGVEGDPVAQADGRKFKVRWTVVENDPASGWCGRARARSHRMRA